MFQKLCDNCDKDHTEALEDYESRPRNKGKLSFVSVAGTEAWGEDNVGWQLVKMRS